MITTADKLSIVTWGYNLFAVLVLLLIGLSWYRKKRLSLFGKVTLLLVLAGMASFADAYWIEPNWLKTEHVVIHDPELAEVLEGVKVVQISDIHLQGGLGNLERNLIAEINALKPDLLFITGDFFSDKQKMELATEVLALSELIRSFKTTTGIFGVPGNYDGPLKNPAIMKKIKAAGIDVLINENRAVALPNHKTLYLAGFGYFSRKNEKLKTFSGIPSDAPVVLLAHDPDNFDEAIEAGVNLLLVGHTHGGQIGIPFLVEKSKKANKSPFMRGLFVRGRTKMYVNRGIATTHVPIRFFNRPEITVIKVQ